MQKKMIFLFLQTRRGAPPFSIDDNLYHTSTEGKVLENPKNSAPEFSFSKNSVS